MVKKQRWNPASNIDRETWQQILKAAEDLFLTKGYKGVSMKDVADAVQVTPAALYYHFPQGKEDLFITMLHAMFEEWAANITRTVASGRNVRERLHLLTLYLLTLPVERFPVMMHDAKEQIKDLERQKGIFLQMRETFNQRIAEVFQQAIDESEIRAGTPAPVIASMYQGMVMSLRYHSHFSVKISERMEPSQMAATLVSALLDGIATRS